MAEGNLRPNYKMSRNRKRPIVLSKYCYIITFVKDLSA